MPSQFQAAFDAAFSACDRDGYNFVFLADLAAALPQYTVEQLHGGIRQLRIRRLYRLNVGEARNGLGAAGLAVAIVDDGAIHTSVSRVR